MRRAAIPVPIKITRAAAITAPVTQGGRRSPVPTTRFNGNARAHIINWANGASYSPSSDRSGSYVYGMRAEMKYLLSAALTACRHQRTWRSCSANASVSRTV